MSPGARPGNYRGSRLAAAAAVAALVCVAGSAAATPDIPEALPASYEVLVFENRSGVVGLDWLRAALPFSLAEHLEAHRGLRPVYGPLVLPPEAPPVLTDADAVAAAAAASGAALVWTGWFRRPNWELELSIALWRVEGGKATKVGEVTARGEFARVHELVAAATATLCAQAGLPVHRDDLPGLTRTPTPDYYAFTLLGRGLAELHGLGGAPDLDKAAKNLARASFIDPHLAEAHRLMAELQLRRKQTAKARGQLGYALDLMPGYYAAQVALAQLSYDDGKPAVARELLEAALERRPWAQEPRYLLGKILWESGDLDGSLLELRRLTRVAPDHLPARRILVLIHASKGATADLVTELEAIVALAPDDPEARLDLGAAYTAAGREQDAIAAYEAVVARSPAQRQALKFLGDLHRKRGELPLAIAYYKQALKASPGDPRPYFLLGEAYVAAGDDRAARRIYNRAQRFPEYLPETYNNLGAIFYRQQDYETSLWYLRRAVARRGDNPRFHYNYALSLSAYGATDAELHYLRGVVLLRRGDADGATAAFERCLALAPEHADARHNLELLEQMRRRATHGEVVVE